MTARPTSISAATATTTSAVAKLNRDMISLDGEVMKMNATNFFEAAWVFKRNGHLLLLLFDHAEGADAH